jgi:hypothetical protein
MRSEFSRAQLFFEVFFPVLFPHEGTHLTKRTTFLIGRIFSQSSRQIVHGVGSIAQDRKASGCLADLAREACDGVRIDPARGEASRAVLKIKIKTIKFYIYLATKLNRQIC